MCVMCIAPPPLQERNEEIRQAVTEVQAQRQEIRQQKQQLLESFVADATTLDDEVDQLMATKQQQQQGEEDKEGHGEEGMLSEGV